MMKSTTDAETYRLRSWSFVLQGKLELARLEIEKALEVAPRNVSIRFLSGVIDYLSATAPSAYKGLPAWPEPISWELVKSDDDSLARLRRAAGTFRALASEQWARAVDRENMEAWALACVANDSGRQKEAAEACRATLLNDPIRFTHIAWGLARNYDFDVSASQEALQRLLKKGKARVPHICTLVALDLREDRPEVALKILDKNKTSFAKEGEEFLWSLWRAQSLAASKGVAAAIEFLNTTGPTEGLGHVLAKLLIEQARETRDWRKASDYLEDSLEKTGDSWYLLMLCQVKAECGEWEFIAKHSADLLEKLPIVETVRLAAFALYHTQRYSECNEILNRHKRLFSQERLSSELRRIQNHCLAMLGDIPEALSKAQALARDEGTPESWIDLAQNQANLGDLRGLSVTARNLLACVEATPVQLLQMAWLARIEDLGVARDLWRQAAMKEFPDEAIGPAVSLGFELGMDKEMATLLKRMHQLASKGQGGIQAKNIMDAVEIIKDTRKSQEELDESYRNGKAPIHVRAQASSLGMGGFFHTLLHSNESAPDPRLKYPLYIRHGGRPLVVSNEETLASRPILLDLTAILLAHQLEILEPAEKFLAPLWIPEDGIPALCSMKEQTLARQPSQIEAARSILNLIDRGELRVAGDVRSSFDSAELGVLRGRVSAELMASAIEDDGLVVTFLPLMKSDLSGPIEDIPPAVRGRIVDCRAVLESLRLSGPLSENEYDQALPFLSGGENSALTGDLPRKGVPLFLEPQIAGQFHSAGILGLVCTAFPTFVNRGERDEIAQVLWFDSQRQELADWLRALIDRINLGITKGAYRLWPPLPERDGENQGRNWDPIRRSLFTVLQRYMHQDAAIWCDDRCISGLVMSNPLPFLGTMEVMKALKLKGAVSQRQYFSGVMRLRAANARFMPMESDEILYHLRQARITGDNLIETGELRTLRQNVSSCLLDKEALIPPRGQGNPGETAFIILYHRAVIEALVGVWKDLDQQVDQKRARAEWLISNLYFDLSGMKAVLGWPQTERDERFSAAVGLAGFLGRAVDFPRDPNASTSETRRGYLEWVFQRLIARRLENDPDMLSAIADMLKRTFLGIVSNKDIPQMMIASRMIIQGFYEDTPGALKVELLKDEEFTRAIGIEKRSVVTMCGFRFKPEDFIAAAHKAINGEEAKLSAIEGASREAFGLSRSDGPSGTFMLRDIQTGEEHRIGGNGLEALVDNPTEREIALEANRKWYDCQIGELSGLTLGISNCESLQDRVDVLKKWVETSATVFYQRLQDEAQQKHVFRLEGLRPPSAMGLLRYLRVGQSTKAGRSFLQEVESASEILRQDEDWLAAFNRLSGLPIRLPASLLSSLQSLSPAERANVVRKLLADSKTPLARLHLFRILVAVSADWPAAERLAHRIVRRCLSTEWIEEAEAFISLLRWTLDDCRFWPDIGSIPPHLKLALIWSHSNRLFSILTSTGAQSSWIRETFSNASHGMPSELLTPDPILRADAAHPKAVDSLSMLVAGLSDAADINPPKPPLKVVEPLVRSRILEKIQDKVLPKISLLKDPVLAPNSLASFLGIDRGLCLSRLLSDETAQLFSSEGLHSIAEKMVGALEEDLTNEQAWGFLHATIGERPAYQDLRERLLVLFRKADLSSLAVKNEKAAVLAVQFVASQTPLLDDPALTGVAMKQVQGVTECLARKITAAMNVKPQRREEDENLYFILLDCALRVCQAGQKPKEWHQPFAEYLGKVMELSEPFASATRPLVQRLCEELPASASKHFAPLLARLRLRLSPMAVAQEDSG